jgi:Lon protease-like protein
MMRRSIENNSRRFGICAPMGESGNNFTGYGTVLFISSLEYTPDGRSLVTTVGERRFMVLERGTRDGYAVARIRFINDDPISDEEKVLLDALQEEVYRHCCQWLQSLPLFTRLKVMQNVCSPLPSLDLAQFSASDGPTWVWWFINALPTSNDNKLQFLSSTSLKQRLLMLKEMLPLPFN